MDLEEIALDSEREVSKVGLKIHSNKIKILSRTGYRILSICINRQNIEGVEQFAYLARQVSLVKYVLSPKIAYPMAPIYGVRWLLRI